MYQINLAIYREKERERERERERETYYNKLLPFFL